MGRHRIEGRACERMVSGVVDVRAFDDGLEEYLKEIEQVVDRWQR